MHNAGAPRTRATIDDMSIPPDLFAKPLDPEALQSRQVRVDAEDALADALRDLLDATIRTKVADDVLAAATEQVRELTALLSTDLHDGALGLQRQPDGRLHDPGNPMTGRRNAAAPPLRIERDDDAQTAVTTFNVGAAYEGPPACVHGGVSASILDQVLGAAATTTGKPGMTAYLNLTYRRPTFLFQDHTVEGRVIEVSQWKSLVRGEIRDAEGHVTVEAEGLFVVPRIARDLLSPPMSDAP